MTLIYGTFYLFFEVLPIIYGQIYDLGPVLLGVTYIGITIGCLLAYVFFAIFIKTQIDPRHRNKIFTMEI